MWPVRYLPTLRSQKLPPSYALKLEVGCNLT